jgi:hypothetical protein
MIIIMDSPRTVVDIQRETPGLMTVSMHQMALVDGAMAEALCLL